MSEYNTQPTIQSLLEETQKGFAAAADALKAFRDEMTALFNEVFRRLENIESRLDRTDRRMANHDAKIDAFIEDIIEMKRDLKHPV
jgi:hypothetical protein